MNEKSYFEAMFGELSPNDGEKTFLLKHADFDKQSKAELIKEAYNKAHAIRQFEIELSWKRATYFWAFELVVLGGLGSFFSKYLDILTCKSKLEPTLIALIAISIGGFYITLLWLFVILGSKSWQENWERHIDLLEYTISGNLYKCMLLSDSAHFSVSKASRNISLLFLSFWASCSLLFFKQLFFLEKYHDSWELLSFISFLIFTYLTLLLTYKSLGNPKKYPQAAFKMTIRGVPS